jgi:16S rRNA (adenine1518-N6/adenine1519-N6)-dimethyltransferase
VNLKERLDVIIRENKLVPNIQLDQNFMIDEKMIKEIVDFAEIKNDETILEIGPGLGFLTEEIAKKSKKVIAVEKDVHLSNFLKKSMDIQVLQSDILDIDLNNLEFDKIISNIPYSITEPLMFKLLRTEFKCAVLTVPKKFMDRVKDSDQYSKLGYVLPSFFDIDVLTTISPDAFYPKPEGFSVVIRMKHKEKLTDEELFIKMLFLQNDKKLKNCLRESLIDFYKVKDNKVVTKNESRKMLDEKEIEEKTLDMVVRQIPLSSLKRIVEKFI